MRRKPATKKRIVRNPRVPRTRNAQTWTEPMYFQRVRSALRTAFRFWVPAMIALKKASRPYKGPKKLLKTEYQCAYCKEWFPRKSVEIDHILEAGRLSSYEDIVGFLQRLTPEDPDSFQVLCKHICHPKKTKKYKQSKKN